MLKIKNDICWDGYLPEKFMVGKPKVPMTFWRLVFKWVLIFLYGINTFTKHSFSDV